MADNALGVLFGEIANAIRTKTGTPDDDRMAPAEFPERIMEMTAGGGSVEGVHFVTFMSEDGTMELYKRPVADGDTCADPVARGLLETPTKESTVKYNYTYSGWASSVGGSANSAILNAVTADKTVYAAYKSTIRSYTVSYYDGETLLKTETLSYGATPSYRPSKTGYEFVSWEPAGTVTGDMVCYAQWKELGEFYSATWAEIAEMAAAGKASTAYALGDYKPVEVEGIGTVEVEIVGFNHDTLADGSGKAAITLGLKNLMSVGWTYKPSSEKSHTWVNSGLRTTIENILPKLPADLQAVIKPVKKEYRSNTSSNNNTATYATCTDSLWAFSARELGVVDALYKEGTPYAWYTPQSTAWERAKKTQYGSTTPVTYWVRTNTAWNEYWGYIKSNGEYFYTGYENTLRYIFGFCV